MSEKFQTFITRLRPHRVAVLIDVEDKEWEQSCAAVIGYLSQIWGGYHSLIIPTDGRVIEDTFWAMLSSFDPDTIICYQKTYEDLRRADTEAFETIVRPMIEEAKIGGRCDVDDEDIRRNLAHLPLSEPSISNQLKKQLLDRLSPFHFDKELQIPYFKAGDTPGYMFTNVADIVDVVNTPDVIFDLKNNLPPDREAPPPLWLAAESGIATPTYQARLQEKGVTPAFKYMNSESDADIIRMGIQPGYSFGENSPFSFTKLALGSVRAIASPRYKIPSIIVIGDTIKDFCLYYGLSRLHGRVIWLPAWFMPTKEPYPRRLMTAVTNLQDWAESEHCLQIAVISTSIPVDQLQATVELLRKRANGSSFVVEDGASLGFIYTFVEHPSKLYVKKNIERITTHQLVDDTLPGSFESPVPSSFSNIDPHKHRWLVEVTFSRNQTPRHPALGTALACDGNLGRVRAGIDGVTYECPGVVVISNDIELQILRPTISVPGPERIFEIALSECGYECSVSDKGRYGAETVRKFGGLEQAGRALREPRICALLKKFLNADDPKEGVFDAGAYIDKRRYLDFKCIVKILGDPSRVCEIIDTYIAKQILYRGLVLQCTRCSASGWFSVAEITQNFTCRRCGTNQQYTHASWKNPNEPSWFYKLDEMVYQMLHHHGDVTLVTLDTLRARAKIGFQFAPELAIKLYGEDKPTMEIDILCISDGKMFIGEAKSVNTLAVKGLTSRQVADKYCDLADKMSASGVIFSTNAAAWNKPTEEAIKEKIAAYPHLKVLVFEANDL